MNWQPSDIITIIALMSTFLGPAITSIYNYHLNKQQHRWKWEAQIYSDNLKITQQRQEEFKKCFIEYLEQTQQDLDSFNGDFSGMQQVLELKVLMYANKELSDEIKSLRTSYKMIVGRLPNNNQLHRVCLAFHKQLVEEQTNAASNLLNYNHQRH